MYRLQTYLPTALLACLIFYFGFHALTGDRGLLGARQRTTSAPNSKFGRACCATRACRPICWKSARTSS
jgi:hypothetical protein